MKRISSLRYAVVLAMATLLTTCLIGGTFARYVTAAEGTGSARVAVWGFSAPATLSLDGLFASSYSNVQSEVSTEAVIAPGTNGNVKFSFPYDETDSAAPEVAYSFSVAVSSNIDESITDNASIQFALDNGTWGTWEQLEASLMALSGDASGTKSYEAGTLPDEFTAKDDQHTIYWQWKYESSDEQKAEAVNTADTALGNGTVSGDISFTITISATQID